MQVESPPPTPEDTKMEELGRVLRASCLPPWDNKAGLSCLLSPIHLKGVSLLGGIDEGGPAGVPAAIGEEESARSEKVAVSGTAMDNEDVAREVDSEVTRNEELEA